MELEIDFMRLAREFARRWILAAALLALGSAAGAVAFKLMAKRYSSQVAFVTQKEGSLEQSLPNLGLLTGKLGINSESGDPPFVAHFEEFIKTRNFTNTLRTRAMGDSTRRLIERHYGAGIAESEDRFNSLVNSLLKATNKEGLFKFEFMTVDPRLSFLLAREALKAYASRLEEVRSKVVDENFAFMQNLVAENQVDLEKRSDQLRKFLEKNRETASPELQQHREELMLKLKLAQEKYVISIKELESVRIKKEKSEEDIVVLDEPWFNKDPVSPNLAKNMALGSFAAALLFLLWVAVAARKSWIIPKPG